MVGTFRWFVEGCFDLFDQDQNDSTSNGNGNRDDICCMIHLLVGFLHENGA